MNDADFGDFNNLGFEFNSRTSHRLTQFLARVAISRFSRMHFLTLSLARERPVGHVLRLRSTCSTNCGDKYSALGRLF